MKFISKNGSELILNEQFSLVNKNISPIKEILNKKDFTSFSFSDDDAFSLADTIQIQVNIVDVGAMIYFFKKEGFQKDDYIAEVSKLKEMKIESLYDVINKVKALYEVSAPFNPLFAIYNPSGKYMIYDDCFKTNFNGLKVIYVSDKNNNYVLNEVNGGTEVNEVEKTEKFKFFNPFPVIAQYKLHFFFAVIATLLLGLTLAIAIYDSYAGKMLCIFFYICSLAGAFLNFMIYKDSLKHFTFKTPFFITTIMSSVVGIGLSIGGYFVFKMLSKPDEGFVAPSVFIIIAAIIGMYLLSTGIAVLYSFLKKRKK